MILGKARSEEGIAEFDSTVLRAQMIHDHRKADAMGEGYNPYFTCTGTEYGQYPIISQEETQEQIKTFLDENRDLLERVVSELPNVPKLTMWYGKPYAWNDVRKQYEPIDALTLSEDLQAFTRLSADGAVCHVCPPESGEDAGACLEIIFPSAIDESCYYPGTIYHYSLFNTTDVVDLTDELIGHYITPFGENWYLQLYELAF